MSQFIVGLTGGIGSGKTTVANMFAKLGIDIIDADIIAREVVEPKTKGLAEISARFGPEILNQDNSLNRAKLREIVFNNESEKNWLNQLLHPLIRTEMIAQCAAAQSAYCILAVPLLLENKLQSLVNRVLVTDCNPNTQISRASHRDKNSASQIQRIMAAQLDRETRITYADDIINTELTLTQIKTICENLHQNYLKLAN